MQNTMRRQSAEGKKDGRSDDSTTTKRFQCFFGAPRVSRHPDHIQIRTGPLLHTIIRLLASSGFTGCQASLVTVLWIPTRFLSVLVNGGQIGSGYGVLRYSIT
jgi:hypothetical protein